MSGKIYKVNGAIVVLDDGVMVIDASGTINSGGWSDIRLEPHIYIEPPADGVQGFDMVGDPPSGTAIQVLQPVMAHFAGAAPDWLIGIRIHAATNQLESLLV